MHCVKLPGQRLMARNFDRQVAEFQIGEADLERLHRTRSPRHEDRGIGLSGKSGGPAVNRSEQQSRITGVHETKKGYPPDTQPNVDTDHSALISAAQRFADVTLLPLTRGT